MKTKSALITAALGSLLALGAVTASAADDANTEKCYGVAKAVRRCVVSALVSAPWSHWRNRTARRRRQRQRVRRQGSRSGDSARRYFMRVFAVIL